MKLAKKGSMFIWCNSHIEYPKVLAGEIGRLDLLIHRLSVLDNPYRLRGLKTVGVVLDHAAELTMKQRENLSTLKAHIV